MACSRFLRCGHLTVRVSLRPTQASKGRHRPDATTFPAKLVSYMGITKVASIHFAPVKTTRNYGKSFAIPVVPLGSEPFILELDDFMQYDEGPYQFGSGGRRQKTRYVVTAEEQAADIVREWTESGRGMSAACRPGIWTVRDRLPLTYIDDKGVEVYKLDPENKQIFRKATAEEFALMWAEDLIFNREADRAYAEWCWNDGNDIAGRTKAGNGYMTTPPVYKLGAKQYGLEAEWLKSAAASDSKICPNCGKPTSKLTFVCAFCQQPTDIERWAEYTAKKDAALRDANNALKRAGQLPPPMHLPSMQQSGA